MATIRLTILAPCLLMVFISTLWSFNSATAYTVDNADENRDDVEMQFSEPALNKRSTKEMTSDAESIPTHVVMRDANSGSQPDVSLNDKRAVYGPSAARFRSAQGGDGKANSNARYVGNHPPGIMS